MTDVYSLEDIFNISPVQFEVIINRRQTPTTLTVIKENGEQIFFSWSDLDFDLPTLCSVSEDRIPITFLELLT